MPYKDKEKQKKYKKEYNKVYKALYYEKNKERLLAAGREHYKKNQESMKARQKKNYRNNPAAYLYYAAKDRAKKLGIEFNLDKEDVIIPAVCPVLGTPFEIGNKDRAPSLDRFDASKGYIKGNVNVISFRANRLKNNATLEEWRKILAWLENQSDTAPHPRITNIQEPDYTSYSDKGYESYMSFLSSSCF